MSDFSSAIGAALSMIVSLDSGLMEIVALSLRVSLSAVVIASLVALPLGALIALQPFPGRRGVVVLAASDTPVEGPSVRAATCAAFSPHVEDDRDEAELGQAAHPHTLACLRGSCRARLCQRSRGTLNPSSKLAGVRSMM